MKKLLCFLLILTCLLPLSSCFFTPDDDQKDGAEDDAWVDTSDDALKDYTNGLSFELNEAGDGYVVTGIGSATDTELVFPKTYEGKPVMAIADNAFEDNTSITSIWLPNCIKNIGDSAFRGCTSLSYAKLSRDSEIILLYAFEGCNIEHAVCPASAIEDLATVSLKKLEIIGDDTVWDTTMYSCQNLTDITIAPTVTTIESSAFKKTSAIKVIDGVGYVDKWAVSSERDIATVSFTEGTVGIADGTFRDCTTLYDVIFPSTLKYIGNNAFRGCVTLCELTFPDSLKKIGALAFNSCHNLHTVVLGEGLEDIGVGAFTYTKALEQYQDKYYLGNWFIECVSEHSVTNLREGTVGIAANAFEYTKQKNIHLPDGLEHISAGAFTNCLYITSLDFPSSVKTIGYNIFNGSDSIQTINYNGTKAEWSEIKLATDWNRKRTSTTIHCNDGDIDLPTNYL